jgi:hypothetical protein
MQNDELFYIVKAIRMIAEDGQEWSKDYCYDRRTNEFHHKSMMDNDQPVFARWFELD